MTRPVRPFTFAAALLLALGSARTPAATETGAPEMAAATQSYQLAISALENAQGAYGADLSEPLLGLGRALQAEGRHEEAVQLFKRGVHLARINDGLYSTRQIPLLQGEISSHIASGNYELADERQRYLYRVQLRARERGEPMDSAFMQQASWQFDAYRLGVGAQDYARLMSMWDLYRLALNDVIDREGDSSRKLLPPLHGMLQTQYLIASYDPQEERSSNGGDDVRARQNLLRFNAYRSQSYEKGSAVIAAIHGIEKEQATSSPEHQLAAAEALAMQGDWHLYHSERDKAWTAYSAALAELAEQDSAQTGEELLFSEPIPLPDIDGLRPLPIPVAPQSNPDAVLLEFGVSETGRVFDLERLDENEELDGRANRLMRTLRKTVFRPRYEAGQPVETVKLVRAYKL